MPTRTPIKHSLCLAAFFILAIPACQAQVGGNAGGYASRRDASPAENERNKRLPTPAELRPDNPSTYIEASILINVVANEYVAVFGVAREGTTVGDATTRMDDTIQKFVAALRAMGIPEASIAVDYISQTPIYGYTFEGNIAKEQRVGFEIKKNVSVRFEQKMMLESLTATAARFDIFDLIKVDYVVSQPNMVAVQQRLQQEVTQIIKGKVARHQALLGIRLSGPKQIVADKPSIYYPVEQYASYTASESENVRGTYDRNRYTVQEARKTRTFYFSPLDADGFDRVLNTPTTPLLIEPVVQFTAYLKVRFDPETAPPAAAAKK